MLKTLLISLVAISSFVNVANAGIIAGNTIPTSLEPNALPESNTDIFLYAETQNLSLTSDLDVDFLADTGLSGKLLAGTRVNSFILNFDAVGNGTDISYTASGSHIFDTEILAVIWTGSRPGAQVQTDENLDKTDSILGVSGVSYGTGALGRGLELEDAYKVNGTTDTFFVNGNQIDIELFVKAAYADQLRVITAANYSPVLVSEPAAFLLFGSALALFGFRRRS
jgi:hypothetical protein